MRSEPPSAVAPSRSRVISTAARLARSLMLAAAAWLAAGGPAHAQPLDALLADVDGHTIASSDAAIARALGVLGLAPSGEPVTRDEVERLADAALLVAEGRRLELAPDAAALAAAWAAAGARVGGAAALDAWLAADRIAPAWAKGLVEQEILRERFIEERFRAFVFIGEAEIDAALGGAEGDREAVRRRLIEAEVQRELAEWLTAARARARRQI